MKIKNIIRDELIGMECEVVSAKNKTHEGIKGKILDETLKMININKKMVPKKDTIFRIFKKNKKILIEGDTLLSRPEDRIKKKIKKW